MNTLKSKIFTLIMFTFLSFSCSGQSVLKDSTNFKVLIKQTNTVIVDVRTAEEFESGHLAQSINIPLQVLPDSVQNLKKFENIILICHSGNRSGKAKVILEENGLKNVYNGGGWEAFQKKLNE